MSIRRLLLWLTALPGVLPAQGHHQLEATLAVPFQSTTDASRSFLLQAEFPGAPAGTRLFWQTVVRSPDGQRLSMLQGEQALTGAGVRDALEVAWPGATEVRTEALVAGFYAAELRATAIEPWLLARLASLPDGPTRTAVALEWAPNGVVEQSWEFQIGAPPQPKLPPFAALPYVHGPRVQPAGAVPYTVYLGNFHSQSNHSDGGGNVATCTSSQGAGNGQFGPADAFAYADNHGLDFLMVSEHNHYFDGSSGTASGASATAALALYQSGLQAAADYNAAHPDFLAIYGMEWGVIDGGGHLNVIGSDQLWGWEVNNLGQLFANVLTPRSDYPALYAQMQTAATIGQFNHPDSNQFLVGGITSGYSANGDEVMVLAEILNTSAFSNRTDEGETGQSSYAGRFNTFLERGFHIAPSSNQDNHCANWGASAPNRTGVLIPNGTALTPVSMMAALRERRVFATADKHGQIVLTGNGHVMGERFENTGPLALTVGYASTNGHAAAQVQIFEGVPQRNGAVTTLVNAASHTFTPGPGAHFYYARITQDDGKLLWSAPLWVDQVVGDSVFADAFE